MRTHAAFLLVAAGAALGTPAAGQEPIADNSFLIEEAYNQEPGVVQHISGFFRSWTSHRWAYSFTQEWPLFGQANQLSYTVPVERAGGGAGGGGGGGGGTVLGDVLVNYRHQVAGLPASAAAAPRLSLLVPTGDASAGGGLTGLQANLPVSLRLGRRWVTHWNAGATARRRRAPAYHLGASAIWLARPSFNLLVEMAWERAEEGEELLLTPGLRWAHNLRGGLQVVPGVAFPLGIGRSRGEQGLFLYLSFEHPFQKSGGGG
ncbi:MAG TPA: hypothetical protein VNI61_03350, partial [Gemmatimonadales bacterium]|nr:hypothetical protein [Gemmatimonadales bacterium]